MDQVSEKDRNISRASLNFRMVEVVMILMLPLLAVAMAVPSKRSSSSLGVFLSIIMVVAYHKINEYAEGMGSLGRIDPFLALWIPFLAFAALICWMFYTIAYVPGGQPIGALDRFFGKFGGVIRRQFARLMPGYSAT